MKNGMRPIHPGEILREEYLEPMNLSASGFARALGVPANRVTALLNEDRAVTADTALRLARCLGTSPEFWLNLQQAYDLAIARKQHKVIEREVRPLRTVEALEAAANKPEPEIGPAANDQEMRPRSERPRARRALATA